MQFYSRALYSRAAAESSVRSNNLTKGKATVNSYLDSAKAVSNKRASKVAALLLARSLHKRSVSPKMLSSRPFRP